MESSPPLFSSILSLFQHRMQYIWIAIQRHLAVETEYLYMTGDFQKGLELYLWLDTMSNPLQSLMASKNTTRPITYCKIFKRLSDRRVNVNFCLLQFLTLNKGNFIPLGIEIECTNIDDLITRLRGWISVTLAWSNQEEVNEDDKHQRPRKKVSWSPTLSILNNTTGPNSTDESRGSSDEWGPKGPKGPRGIKTKKRSWGILQRSKSFDLKSQVRETGSGTLIKRRKTESIPSAMLLDLLGDDEIYQ